MDEKDAKLVAYLSARHRAGAKELATLVGLTIPSIRYRLFHLMATGFVGQEKTPDHRVWFFIANKRDTTTSSQNANCN
jgi:predicted ArsR family transcriptional regulator